MRTAAVPTRPGSGGVDTIVMFRKSHDRTRTELSAAGVVSVLKKQGSAPDDGDLSSLVYHVIN